MLDFCTPIPGTRSMAPGAPAAGWCPGRMCSPRSYVADAGCSWAPTKAHPRKGKAFLAQPSLSCLSFSRGRVGRSPPKRKGGNAWVLRAPACLASALSPFRDPRQKIQASGPRAPVSEAHWPLPWPLLQSGLAELPLGKCSQ